MDQHRRRLSQIPRLLLNSAVNVAVWHLSLLRVYGGLLRRRANGTLSRLICLLSTVHLPSI
jgi:hypothetical protein